MDIFVTMKDFQLILFMYNPNIHFEGSMSQNFKLGPSFYFMTKNGFLVYFFLINFYIS